MREDKSEKSRIVRDEFENSIVLCCHTFSYFRSSSLELERGSHAMPISYRRLKRLLTSSGHILVVCIKQNIQAAFERRAAYKAALRFLF